MTRATSAVGLCVPLLLALAGTPPLRAEPLSGSRPSPPDAVPAAGGPAGAPGRAGDWKVKVLSEKPSIETKRGNTKGYVRVTVQASNGTKLGGVRIATPCDSETTAHSTGAHFVEGCAGITAGASVRVTLSYSGRSGSFTARTGHVYVVELRDDREPPILRGRLVWRGTGRPLTGSMRVFDGEGNSETLDLDGSGHFREKLPEGIRRGEHVGTRIQQSRFQGLVVGGNPGPNSLAVPSDGDLGTLKIHRPELEVELDDVRWRPAGDRIDGEAAVRVDGNVVATKRLRQGSADDIATGLYIRKPRKVTVEVTPDLVPGLTFRKRMSVEPDYFTQHTSMKPTPPRIIASGRVVDRHEQAKPVKADLSIETRNRGTVATASTSRSDPGFRIAVDPWSDPVTRLSVVPDRQLYPSLKPRTYGRAFWKRQLSSLTAAYDGSQPKVVAPGKKAVFRMDHLALELDDEIRPMAVEGRLRWKRQRLHDQLGNPSPRRSHSFQDDYPLGQLEVLEFDATGIQVAPGGEVTSTATRTRVGSTRLAPNDDGDFRVEFDDFYGTRTVFLRFTPASLPSLTYETDAISVRRGDRVQREIPHPALDLHGAIRDADGCAVRATITFYPTIPWDDQWRRKVATSNVLDDAGRNFSATLEHLPVRKVVIEPTVDYLRTRTLTREEWRDLLDGSITAYDPSRQHLHELGGSGRPRFLVQDLDLELEYVRPSTDHPDVDRDGVPRDVEKHLAEVHTPSYEFDARESQLPGDVASYLEASVLKNLLRSAGEAGVPGLPDPGGGLPPAGGYYLHNRRPTPSPLRSGPVYVRVMKLDAGRLENAAYRIAYGLWYDRGRHGPFYLSGSAGRSYHGAFREVLVDVHRGEVQRVFLRNYAHNGAGERTIAGIDFDFATGSFTYGPGGTSRRPYDPLVEEDELRRLQWETFGFHDGDRRPQYFRVFVAADTHNQFVTPGKTFLRPVGITADSEEARKVKRAVFGTSTFVPQVHRGTRQPPPASREPMVLRPETVVLGEAPPRPGQIEPRGLVGKPSGEDIRGSFLGFPGHWGQDRTRIDFEDGSSESVWLSTAGPGPMDYETADRLATEAGAPHGYAIDREKIERIRRRARNGGDLFGRGFGGSRGGAAGGGGGSGGGGPSPATVGDHMYAWSGDARFKYLLGGCLDGRCSFGGGPLTAVAPDIGGEVSGLAQAYPSTGDAYLDASFFAHALGSEQKFVRVTGMRQSRAGSGATTATSVAFHGVLQSLNSLPRGTTLSYELAAADATLSFLGFEIGSEVALEAVLKRPKVTSRDDGTRRARVLDAGLTGTWSIVQVGFDATDYAPVGMIPTLSFSPVQATRSDIFRSTMNVEVTPAALRSYVELSANYNLSIGVGAGVGVGDWTLGSGFTNFDIFDYRIGETRFDLLK